MIASLDSRSLHLFPSNYRGYCLCSIESAN